MVQRIGDFIAEKTNHGSTNGEAVHGTATGWMVKNEKECKNKS